MININHRNVHAALRDWDCFIRLEKQFHFYKELSSDTDSSCYATFLSKAHGEHVYWQAEETQEEEEEREEAEREEAATCAEKLSFTGVSVLNGLMPFGSDCASNTFLRFDVSIRDTSVQSSRPFEADRSSGPSSASSFISMLFLPALSHRIILQSESGSTRTSVFPKT